MSKLPKEKRDRIILVVVGTLIFIGVGWFSLIKSQNATLQEHRKSTLRAQEKLANAKRRVEKQKQIQDDLESAKHEIKAIEDEMASGDLYSWLIVTLNKFRIPYKNKVEIPNFSREQVGEMLLIPGFPYKAAAFTIRGTAYYHDLGRFTADFENSFPYVRLLNLEMEPVGLPSPGSTKATTDDEEKLSFKMEIVALIKPSS
jgi:Tfp pilus assembly protein PilO